MGLNWRKIKQGIQRTDELYPVIEQLSFADALEWSFNEHIASLQDDIESMKSNIQWRFPSGPHRDNLKKMVAELNEVLKTRESVIAQWQ